MRDDADVFKAACDAVGLRHQVCRQHGAPNTLTLLSWIADQREALPSSGLVPAGLSAALAWEDLAVLEDVSLARAPGSQRQLEEHCRRYQGVPGPPKGKKASPWSRLRLLTVDVAEDGPCLTLSEWYRDWAGQRVVPAMNKVSERGIGMNIKGRDRTMQVYKSRAILRCYPMPTASVREQRGGECFSGLLAS